MAYFMIRANAVLLALVLATALPARAQGLPFLHPIFTSDMVVQRDAIVPIRGWTTPGARVELSFAGAQAAATADASGAWRADLGPFPAGGTAHAADRRPAATGAGFHDLTTEASNESWGWINSGLASPEIGFRIVRTP